MNKYYYRITYFSSNNKFKMLIILENPTLSDCEAPLYLAPNGTHTGEALQLHLAERQETKTLVTLSPGQLSL